MAKRRNPLTAEQHDLSSAAVSAMAEGFRRKTFEPTPSASPDDALSGAAMTMLESGRERTEAARAEEQYKLRDGYGLWDFTQDSVGAEGLLFNTMVMANHAGYKADLNWRLPSFGSDDFKALTEGVPEEHWGVFARAVSREHALALRFKVVEELDRTQRMHAYGGTAGVMAANILNPENVLLSMATGGLAWVSKGGRLARALKSGALAGVENAAMEAALNGMQETRDEWDILYGALGGIALGGAFGAIGKGIPDDVKVKAAATARRELDDVAQKELVARGLVDEADLKLGQLRKLEDEVRTRARDELSTRAGSVLKRSELGALGRELGSARKALQKAEGAEAHRLKVDELSDIEARMHSEDVASMGEVLANSKHQVKMRKAAAKAEHAERTAAAKADHEEALQSPRDRAARLEEQHAKALDGEDALNKLRKLERQEKRGTLEVREFLDHLSPAAKEDLSPRLKSARDQLAKALKLSRKAEREVAPKAVPGGFGPDTASAARVSPDNDFSVRDLVNTDDVTARADFEPTARARTVNVLGRRFELGFPRFDFASILRSIRHEDARGTVGLYVGDSIGAEKGLNPVGASEVASRLHDTGKMKFHTAYEPGFKEFLKEVKGLDGLAVYTGKHNRAFRKEYGDLVDLAVRGLDPNPTPAVAKAAAKLRALYLELGERANKAGVKGFENWKPDPNYAPRVFDWLKIGRMEGQYGTDALEAFVIDAVRSGMRKAGTDVMEDADKLARLIGKGYFNTLRQKGAGMEPSAFNGIKMDDLDKLAAILDQSGASSLQKSEVLTQVSNLLKPREKEAGAVRYGKGRTLVDEDHRVGLKDINGDTKEVSFRDLFMEHDAEQLFENYSRSMSGHIGLAEVAGVRSAEDHARLMEKMTDMVTDRKEREKVVSTMDDAYRLMTGKQLNSESKYRGLRRLGSALRNYNFARVMNQVGFAQIPDAAAYLTPQYLKYTRRYFPEAHNFMRRAADGTLDHKFAKEVEELLATGTDFDANNLFSRFEDEFAAKENGLERALQAGEHGLKVAGRFTSTFSGLRHLTDFNQRMSGMVAMNRIIDNAAGLAKDMNAQRLLNLGLDEKKIARIKAQVDKHVTREGKHKLKSLNIGDWDDATALDDLASAAFREARRMVQEEDLGDTHWAMHHGLGKVLMQFRRFPLVAYTKQLGYGIVHGDAETLAQTGLQITLGSMSYTAQMYLYSTTMPEEEAAEFRAKFLTPQAIFMGGITRAGMFSILPQMALSAFDTFTAGDKDELGNKMRTSGLSAGVMGIPAIDLIARTTRFASDVAISTVRGDREFDQSDFDNARRILPFQNAFVIKQLLDHMKTMLPEKDVDDDPEDIAWFLSGN